MTRLGETMLGDGEKITRVDNAGCSWCGDGSATLPSTFCWTKMAAEAGQPLTVIIRRKDLERAHGAGIFYWGVGNALGTRVTDLVRNTTNPEILFSIMKSRPKREDEHAETVVVWESYTDDAGLVHELPEHAIVLSRGTTNRGPKSYHYALVCHSRDPLTVETEHRIDSGHLRNLGSEKQAVGFSQVTAVVEHTAGPQSGPHYHVAFRAALVPPYFIRLCNPRVLTDEERTAIAQLATGSLDATAWLAFARHLRRPGSKTPLRKEH